VGDEIPLLARIIFACDAYDAMTTERPYSPARTPEGALAEMRENAGTQFDPEIVERLEHVVRFTPVEQLPVPQPAPVA
jgi:HD-GYP domain-containing protein (c-di-GMP phosphodiesterase class II)